MSGASTGFRTVPLASVADSAAFAWGVAGLLLAVSVALLCVAANRHVAWRATDEAARGLRDLYENISEGVFRSTLDGRMISANPALVRLNGFSSEEEMLNEVNDIAGRWYVEPGRREAIHRMLLEHGKVTGILSEVFRYKTRERIWIEESTRLVRDQRTGRSRYYDGSVREVTETVRRLQLQERFEKIASVTAGCLYQLRTTPDGRAKMLYVSVGLKRIFGLDLAEAEANPSSINALVHPDDRRRLDESFATARTTLAPRRTDYRIRTREGVEKWVSGHSVPELEPDGSLLWHGYVEDITERKQAEERVHRLAFFDPLTGLPNRAALVERLREAMEASCRTGTSGAVLFVDLDQFKILNDTKGHHSGDALLVHVARRLDDVGGGDASIARLGGDEFVVMVAGLAGAPDAVQAHVASFADRILAALARPFTINGAPFHTSASVGVSCFNGDDADAGEHLKRADLAMYEAKASGRGQKAFFVPEMQAAVDNRLALTNELHDALDNRELTFVCQPQVHDARGVIGVELLMRWNSPTRGEVRPAEFVALAERAGLSGMLDVYVLRYACGLLRRWAANPGTRDLSVAVNVSCRQLRYGFATALAAVIDAMRIDARRLTVELTEHVMLDNSEEVADIMAQLKAIGVAIALDDFGTGYSSLSNLKLLPIDTLKIDLSFVRDIETDPNDRVIVQTIVNVANSLGKWAIAEGVETEMQATLLRQFGCRAFQGYLFGRPMPIEDFEGWIAQRGEGVIYGRVPA